MFDLALLLFLAMVGGLVIWAFRAKGMPEVKDHRIQ